MSRRQFRKQLRLLVPAVVLGAVVLVPGVASASDDDPIGTATSGLQDAAPQLGGSGPEIPDPGSLEDNPVIPSQEEEEGDTSGGTTPPGGLPDDSSLRDAFSQALGPLAISEDCVNGVFDGFENVITALQNSDPRQLPDLLNQFVGALRSGDPSAVADDLQSNGLGQALQDLATTLQEKCMPTPPPAGGSHNTPPPAAAQPVVPAAQPAPPAAAAPVAQPVSYPGYAPTGGTPDDSSDAVPLAVLGGIVLLSGGGAAGYRMSTRGARSRG